MSEFHYILGQEKGHLFITIEAGRILYREDLLNKEKNKDLARFLIQEELRYARISPLDNRAGTHPMHRIHISPSRAFDAVKDLALTSRLFLGKKRLYIDPFTAVALNFEASIEGEKLLVKLLPEMEWGFGGEQGFGVFQGTIRPFARWIDGKWLELPSLLEEEEKKRFIDRFEDGEHPRAPTVIWKTPIIRITQEPTPFLVLKDRTGGFVDLWLDYGDSKTIAFHDPKIFSWRNGNLERQWEKDLLETDFVKKIVGESHYYCPLDKVSESLRFLHEVGWKIIDHQGRKVVSQTASNWSLGLINEKIVLRGGLRFGELIAAPEVYLGAWRKKELFVSLSEHEVGLLDARDFPISWNELEETEVVTAGIVLSKYQMGIIEPLLSNEKIQKEAEIEELFTEKTAILNHFEGILHSYQQKGVDWLFSLKRRGLHALLADEMGLGKTVQVLAFLSTFERKKAVLIVVPTSLIFHWRREIEKFLPQEHLHIHTGPKRGEILPESGIILTSYALLRLDADLFSKISFSSVILDEAQVIKNPESQVAKAAYGLQAQFRLALTGTPVENRMDDLWSLFHFLMPRLLGESRSFSTKKLRPFILRRRKDQVASDLPPKLEQTIWVEMDESQKAFYEDWMKKSRSGLIAKISLDGAGKHRMEILETILRLRQICCHPNLIPGTPPLNSGKLERIIEDLAPLIAEKRKILLYSQFTSMLHMIEKEAQSRSWPYLILEGATTDREGVVRAFQEDPEISLFLISLKAGGVGLNLYAADYVFLFDPWWNEAVENQAIDRAHRLGRKGTLIARRYVMVDSIEEKIMQLKEQKKTLSEHFLEPTGDDLSVDDLLGFIS